MSKCMISRLKLILRRLVSVDSKLFAGRLSYSQEGEDLVLARILQNFECTNGFFVDIGAHHPTRFSNTFYFYSRGWRGINVDAMPGTKKLFDRMRSRDITIECGIGAEQGLLKYFSFNESALNTFSESEAIRKNVDPYYIINTLLIPVVTLKQILDDHLPKGTQIDFMTIDAEGFDHDIVSSGDWCKYRPRVLLLELLNTEIQGLENHPTAALLKSHNYRAIAKTYNTCFFVANETLPQNV